ncbi:hypothetical protein LWI29_019001 [Acer saccharum]|uniref:CCG-binding protein 1 n=1 Tax=Acer saccharum TaxID=4024 RepID=A0AA39RWM5_ACESA|nr:hypothetical protein LWI29_019001 [Acer saccharum]
MISSSLPVLVEANKDKGIQQQGARTRTCPETTRFSSIVCSSSSSSNNNSSHIPKLEPFSRTKLERAVRDRPLIEKSENDLSDYCSTLEGDDSYSCWKAYFELKDLERAMSKQDVENLILQSGGVKSLIGFLHGISSILKGKVHGFGLDKPTTSSDKEGNHDHPPCPIPDGLPKSLEELEEEEKGRLPDSPYTKLLRNKGKFPDWYSPAPDHETD